MANLVVAGEGEVMRGAKAQQDGLFRRQIMGLAIDGQGGLAGKDDELDVVLNERAAGAAGVVQDIAEQEIPLEIV